MASLQRAAAASPPLPSAAPEPSSSADAWDSASLSDFTRWNEEAMKALRAGDGATSRHILTSLLPALQTRLHDATSAKKTAAATPDELVVMQSWRLMYALTLNNYGCQLRRDGLNDEALKQFMLAKEVESTALGKPSCSTMLNLSAVLLSNGQAKEALKIATECAAAAQDGEPVLFITALHNLAVALGQQSSERSRRAALPTMLQALREAQSALGEQHPTTKMLKEKCGLTSQWMGDTCAATTWATPHNTAEGESRRKLPLVPQLHSRSSQNRETAPGSATAAQERARVALYALDFGSQPIPAVQPMDRKAVTTGKPHTSALPGNNSARRERDVTSPLPVDNLRHHLSDEKPREGTKPTTDSSSGSEETRLPPIPVEKRGEERAPSGAGRDSTERTSPTVDDVRSDSNVAASVDKLCLDSADLSTVELSISSDGPETVLQEPFRPSALSFHGNGAVTLRDLCGVMHNGSAVYPSFLRFGVPLPPVPSTATAKTTNGGAALGQILTPLLPHTASSSPAAKLAGEEEKPAAGAKVCAQTAPIDSRAGREAHSRVPSRQHYEDKARRDGGSYQASASASAVVAASPQTADAAKGPAEDSRTSNSEAKVRHTLFGSSSRSRWSSRAAQRQADAAEEEAYRRELQAAQKAAETAHAFERGLQQVHERTRTRAARAIQRAWRQWWSSVGQPRRHVQLQRLEELQRRRRERLALSSSATGRNAVGAKSHAATAVAPPPLLSQQQCGRVAGYVVPAVVVRCARTWMTRTACVRCAARLTGAKIDVRLHETDLRRRINRVQALWRGALQRMHGTQARKRDTAVNAQRDAVEEREYAAMVVQGAYRCYAARQARQRLYKERHDAPAAIIQRWLRQTWADQRQRGVDAPTQRRRHAAAVDIQRTWRGYQGRIAFCMRELRHRIDQAGPYMFSVEAAAEGYKGNDCEPADKAPVASDVDKKVTPQAGAAPPTSPPPPPSSLTAAADAYMSQCLERSVAVQRLRDDERDLFHVPLFVENRAAKERAAWQEAIRLRPTEVLQRRAELDAQIDAEQAHFVLHRAACVIQRAYRAWAAMRRDGSRDTGLLEFARMRYQQQELGRAVERKQHKRDLDRAMQLYGDTTAAMRGECELATAALALATADLDHSRSPLVLARREEQKSLTFPQPGSPSRSQLRREQEAVLRRDERLLALTRAHEAAHLREGPVECEARLGATYEHPYYIPYVNEEHQRTLGID